MKYEIWNVTKTGKLASLPHLVYLDQLTLEDAEAKLKDCYERQKDFALDNRMEYEIREIANDK